MLTSFLDRVKAAFQSWEASFAIFRAFFFDTAY